MLPGTKESRICSSYKYIYSPIKHNHMYIIYICNYIIVCYNKFQYRFFLLLKKVSIIHQECLKTCRTKDLKYYSLQPNRHYILNNDKDLRNFQVICSVNECYVFKGQCVGIKAVQLYIISLAVK